MKLYALLVRALFLVLAFCAPLASHSGVQAATAETRWTSVSSDHFLLVGNGAERDLRQLAINLEQFRSVLAQLPSTGLTETQKQTTALVFRSQGDYEPFAPLFDGQHSPGIAGHFQFSPEINYIAFSFEQRGARSPSSVAIHEYVHGLIKNSLSAAPVWFDEGLAEYYSTFELAPDGHRAILGRPVLNHVLYLRDHELLPLQTLLAVNHYSPDYVDHNRRSLFYAESWALVHYLLNGGAAERQEQLLRFLDLQSSGLSINESVREAFNCELSRLEAGFRQYVRSARFAEELKPFEQRADFFEPELRSKSLAEAEGRAYLGELLLRAGRFDEAAEHLKAALALSPDLPVVRTSFGLLRLEQNQYAEAREHLERAIQSDPQSFLAHYYYAELLSRDGEQSDKTVAGFIVKTALIRAELKKVLALKPDFAEAYLRLAEVDVQRSAQLDETTALLQKAMTLWPGREEFTLLLAQVHLRREEFDRAREILNRLGLKSSNPRTLAQAQNLLNAIKAQEADAVARRAEAADAQVETALWQAMQPCDMPEPGPQIKGLRFLGKQICGQLEQIECADNGSILSVAAGGQTLKFHSEELKRIKFITYTPGLSGRIECGERNPASQVLLTYKKTAKLSPDFSGEVIAVEFVPPDWNH